MSSLADLMMKAGLANRIVSDRQLEDLIDGSDARRYGLINRALKDGTLLRLKRGRYMFADRYRSELAHPFPIAQALLPGSYVSFETALAYHGWIPEAVYVTACVAPRRKSIFYETAHWGNFEFRPLALHEYQLLVGVERVKHGGLMGLVAKPLRALMDLVALRKVAWSGIDWVIDGMRIDEEQLMSLRRADFELLERVYKHKAAIKFLNELESKILGGKSA